jgi:hypothetical protein
VRSARFGKAITVFGFPSALAQTNPAVPIFADPPSVRVKDVGRRLLAFCEALFSGGRGADPRRPTACEEPTLRLMLEEGWGRRAKSDAARVRYATVREVKRLIEGSDGWSRPPW